MKNLLIVESPTKVKSIEKFLGNEYKVLASVGHVRDLVATGKKGINVENGYEPVWKVSNDKKEILADIKKYSEIAESVYFATDPDREGEAISKHIFDILNKSKLLTNKKIYRIAFNEITKNAVLEAIKNPREISDNLWNAYLARRTLDYLMGYDISEFLWKKVSRDARAGRVQSPALRLIVEREKIISEFKPVEFWITNATLCKDSDCITAELISVDGEKIKKDNITSVKSEAEAKIIKNDIESNNKTKIESIKSSERKNKPRAPFTTASLQQTAYTTLGFSVRQTSSIAQKLYQGISIEDEGLTGLITYMRTDSTNLSVDHLNEIKDYLNEKHPKYTPKEFRKYANKVKNAQEAHEAIRPTSIFNTPEKIKKYLDQNEFKLYDLIWRRTVASQMTDAIHNQLTLEMSMNDKYIFRFTGSFIKESGFKEVYNPTLDDDKEKINKVFLEGLKEGENLSLKNVNIEQKFTQPPPRYNQASLIAALEELGIGRPSTYVTIISKIMESNYIDPDKSNFQPTALAKVVCETLTEHFSNDLVDFEFTARLEDDLDKISRGEQDFKNCIKETYEPFRTNLLNKQETVDISEQRELKNLGIHPETKRPVTVRLTKYGPTIQMGTKEDEEKPKWAALTPELKKNIDNITLDDAMKLFNLPEKIGLFENEDILINIGPYGPYIKCGNTNVSVRDKDIFEITEIEAQELIKDKKELDANKQIKFFEKSNIKILNGIYGPYVTNGKVNVKVPKDVEPSSLEESVCIEMLDNAPKRKRRRFRSIRK